MLECARVSLQQQIQALVLIAMAVINAAALARRQPPGRVAAGAAVVTVVLDGVWLSLHNAYEGPTVINAGFGHGLALADLGVPPSLLLAGLVLLRWFRR